MNINRVFLAGNLTRDPEVRAVGAGSVASFGMAINRKWKDKDGALKEEVTFVDIEAWGRTGELCGQYLTKGAEVFVEGRLKLDTWEKDGQKHSKMRVVAETVQFGRKPQGGEGGGQRQAAAPRQAAGPAAPPAAGARPAGAAGDDEPPF